MLSLFLKFVKTSFFALLFCSGAAYALDPPCLPPNIVRPMQHVDTTKAYLVGSWWCEPTEEWMDYTATYGFLKLSALSATDQQAVQGLIFSGNLLGLLPYMDRSLPVDSAEWVAARARFMPAIAATRPPAKVVTDTATKVYVYDMILPGGEGFATIEPARFQPGWRAACNKRMLKRADGVYCNYYLPNGTYLKDVLAKVRKTGV